ncbi:MAG: hypothetical protein LC541_14880 [Candidatus Thiodiazotropha sp.]|nr:hypothetical protein [Candidatus Thiodiazotropha sp.]MCM8884554.1 hypothetical protein [Candidatus Thiodiazotropha sp.]
MTIKYINDLNPLLPRPESYVADGIKDITNIKKALLASFVGCDGTILVHLAMDSNSTNERIILTSQLVEIAGEVMPLPISEKTIIVFRSHLNNAAGVKIAFNTNRFDNVMDANGAPLDEGAIRKDSVSILIHYASTYFLLGYFNRTESEIPKPGESDKAKLLSNDGADFIWSDPPVPPPNELPEFNGHGNKYLKLQENQLGRLFAKWAPAPKPPRELPGVDGNKDKALHVVEDAKTKTLSVSWETVQKNLPPLEDNVGKALHVIEDPSTQALGVNWEAVQEALPPLSGAIGKALIVRKKLSPPGTEELEAVWENVEGELPEKQNNVGKYLRVVQTGSGSLGIDWVAVKSGSVLPPIKGAIGKTLHVVIEDGKEKIEWEHPGRELPDYREKSGKMLSVKVNAERAQLDWVDPPIVLPEMKDQQGKILQVVEALSPHKFKAVWKTIKHVLPPLKGAIGKTLIVRENTNTSGKELEAVWENVGEILPEKKGNVGKYLCVTQVDDEHLGLEWDDLSEAVLPPIDEDDGGKYLPVPPSIALSYF